ncbi:MAG: DUF1697 domain-containing protein [Clostridiaceae bacterium]
MVLAAFLRGINTGKQNLKMQDLVYKMNEAGFNYTKSYLASGNLVFKVDESKEFSSETDISEIKKKMEVKLNKLIFDLTGWDIGVLVRDKVELEALVGQCNEISIPVDNVEYHMYAIFANDDGVFKEVSDLFDEYPHGEGEGIFGSYGDFFWRVRKGDTLGAFGSKVLGSKKFKERLTSRNMNTVNKVIEIMNKANESI